MLTGLPLQRFGGALHFQRSQVGFAAEITAAYSSSIGYEWKYLSLVEGVMEEATSGPGTGAMAFALDGSTSLAVGTVVWLEPSPNAQGYIITQASGDADEEGDCAGVGWVAGLDTTDCIKVSVVSGIAEQMIFLTWDGAAWSNATDELTYPNGTGALSFSVSGGQPHLTLDGAELVLDCGRPNYAIFAGGPATTHDNATTTTCELRHFRLKVECSCCVSDIFTGPGWYCVEDENSQCRTVVFIAGDGDECEDIGFCAGPYATQELAQAACGTTITDCCPNDPWPMFMTIEFANDGTGSLVCYNGHTVRVMYGDTAPGSGPILGWGTVPAGSWPGEPCGHSSPRIAVFCGASFLMAARYVNVSDFPIMSDSVTPSAADCTNKTLTFELVADASYPGGPGTITATFRP
jgi:hypothetical protein